MEKNTETLAYNTPEIEIYDIAAEKGFATSDGTEMQGIDAPEYIRYQF